MSSVPFALRRLLPKIAKSRIFAYARLLLMPLSPQWAGFGINVPTTRWLGARPPSNLNLVFFAAGSWIYLASAMLKPVFQLIERKLPPETSIGQIEDLRDHWANIVKILYPAIALIAIFALTAARYGFHRLMAWLATKSGVAVAGVPLTYVVAGTASGFLWLAVTMTVATKLLFPSPSNHRAKCGA